MVESCNSMRKIQLICKKKGRSYDKIVESMSFCLELLSFLPLEFFSKCQILKPVLKANIVCFSKIEIGP